MIEGSVIRHAPATRIGPGDFLKYSDQPDPPVTLLGTPPTTEGRAVTKDRGGAASRHVRTLFSVGAVAGLTDGLLLERFTTGPREAAEMAFAALVERHGPMV